MIPVLYEKTERNFTSNGICRLVDCIRCEVTEERNGVFEVEFEYPVNGRYFDEITIGRIIYVAHDETNVPQPFDIYKYSATIDGIVTFYASHISYRLGQSVLQPFTASTIVDAFEKIPENTLNGSTFSYWTDKSVTADFSVIYPKNVRETLSGSEGSILDVYGTGEYEFDKWQVKLYLNRGTDTNVQIRYGKNLSDITAEKDDSGTYNAVIPYWHSAETGTTVIASDIIFADGTNSIVEAWTEENDTTITDENREEIEFDCLQLLCSVMDLSMDFTEQPTEEELYNAALAKFTENQPWIASENIDVNFVQLWQTEEYASVAPLQRLFLCDTALVLYADANVVVRKKVIKVVYDALKERYSSMELGTPQATLGESIRNATQTTVMQSATVMMNDAINRASQLITGGLGGYVVINMINDRPAEILVLDNPDIASAVNVLRINQNGIGFSSTGYNGTYGTAWTLDGTFNADYITTGTLSANRIYGGLLQAINGNSYWNLDSGSFANEGTQTKVVLNGGQIYFYYTEDGETPVGQIRTTSASGILGVSVCGAEGSYSALSVYTSNSITQPVFIANDGEYSGYTEKAIIGATCRMTAGLYLNGTAHFHTTLNDTLQETMRMEGVTSGFYGDNIPGSALSLRNGFLTIRALNSNSNYERLVSIQGNRNYGSFGYIHFHREVEFGEAMVFGSSSAQSGYTYGNMMICATQLQVGRSPSISVITPATYGMRVYYGIYCDSSISCDSLTQRSDERLKDFEEWDERYDHILDDIEPKIFSWKKDEKKRKHIGYSAQEVQKVIADLGIDDCGIVNDEDTYLSLTYNDLNLLMLHKQKKKIEALESRIDALERTVEELCRYMNSHQQI